MRGPHRSARVEGRRKPVRKGKMRAMARYVTVAAAQLGAINEGTSREEMVDRMLTLLEQAIREGVQILAYPELALTPYFPKRIRDDYDQFFETEVPPKCLEPLLMRAGQAGVVC